MTKQHYPILEAPTAPPLSQFEPSVLQQKIPRPESARSSNTRRLKRDEKPKNSSNFPDENTIAVSERPLPKFSNLYGVIDTNKLKSLFGGDPETETHRSARYIV